MNFNVTNKPKHRIVFYSLSITVVQITLSLLLKGAGEIAFSFTLTLHNIFLSTYLKPLAVDDGRRFRGYK